VLLLSYHARTANEDWCFGWGCEVAKKQIVKRLAPSLATLRQLYMLSGNFCAFPGCKQAMLNEKGQFVGQICHIEAAEAGGERFNPNMTNQERAAFNNLMLMCYPHHVKTDDVTEFTADKLKKMKADHERLFEAPEKALGEKFVDQTTFYEPEEATTLDRYYKHVGHRPEPTQLSEEMEGFQNLLNSLRHCPIKVRNFLCTVVKRMVDTDDTAPLAEDMREALNLGLGKYKTLVGMAEKYGLLHFGEGFGHNVWNLELGHDPYLASIAYFCRDEHIDVSTFLIDLRFDQLDK
jgi:hypothetical protein